MIGSVSRVALKSIMLNFAELTEVWIYVGGILLVVAIFGIVAAFKEDARWTKIVGGKKKF